MDKKSYIIPSLLILVGLSTLFSPGLESSDRLISFSVAIMCATVYSIITRKNDSIESKAEFKVSVKEISFIHYERGREDRPTSSQETTEIYDKALEHFRRKDYMEACSLFARAFELGDHYWPAKINEGFCYQALGKLDYALVAYDMVIQGCSVPRFRRQALGNSGEILMAKAGAATKKEEARSLVANAYEKYTAAYSTERTFVSTYNLWQVATLTKKQKEAEILFEEIKKYPEYSQLSDEQKTVPNISI